MDQKWSKHHDEKNEKLWQKPKKKLFFRNGSKKWWKTMAKIHRNYRNMGKRNSDGKSFKSQPDFFDWEPYFSASFGYQIRAPGPGGPQGIHCDHHLHHIAKGGIQHPSLMTEGTMPWNGIIWNPNFSLFLFQVEICKTWKMGDHGGPKNDFAHGPTRQGSIISARAPLHRSWWPPPTPAVPTMPPTRGSGPDPDPSDLSSSIIYRPVPRTCILQSVSMSFFQTASNHFKRQHFMAKRILNQIQAFFLKNEGKPADPARNPQGSTGFINLSPMVFPWFFPWKMTTGYHRSTSVASPKILANGRSASVPKMVKDSPSKLVICGSRTLEKWSWL